MDEIFDLTQKSAGKLKETFGSAPEIAVVLGSGLAGIVPGLDAMKSVSFADIPGFAQVSVVGHKGTISVGSLEAKGHSRRVAFVSGRHHAYEGYNAHQVVHCVRSLVQWGVKGIVLTNAAGCLQTSWNLGSFMVLQDHVNLTGLNPLVGREIEKFGPRFLDMTHCYDVQWQQHLQGVAKGLSQQIYQGVYFGVLGSTYETPAEIRMFQKMGASAVGMSTVLEAIAARHCGARVAGLSCLTNYAAGLVPGALLNHSDVIQVGLDGGTQSGKLLIEALVTLPF